MNGLMSNQPKPMIINLTDQNLFDAVAYAGAYNYSWFHSFQPDPETLTIRVAMENGLGDVVHTTVNMGSVREAIEGIHADDGNFVVCSVDWGHCECDSDIDCDIADCILQFAVLGEVVFG